MKLLIFTFILSLCTSSWAGACKKLEMEPVPGTCLFEVQQFVGECPAGWYATHMTCEEVLADKAAVKAKKAKSE